MSGRDDMIHTHSGVKLTYDDYVLFPDDGQKHELIDGVHYVTPAPVWKHHTIVGNLFALIWTYLQQHPIGVAIGTSIDVIFSQYDVVEPDVLYISHERLAQLEPSDWIKGAPNLVVEVGSPSTRKRDETIKHRLYEQFGVDEYWIIDPKRATIAVFRSDCETPRAARIAIRPSCASRRSMCSPATASARATCSRRTAAILETQASKRSSTT